MAVECWLHQVHLPWLASKVTHRTPAPWLGVTQGTPPQNESVMRRTKLENVLKRVTTGQSLSDKEPSTSRYGTYSGLQKHADCQQMSLTRSGISWEGDDGSLEIIPILMADVMCAQVQPKFSFSKPDATHVMLVAPRVQSMSAVWLLCTNAGTGDFSVDHFMMSLSRRGAVRWDVKDCCHFSAKCCGQGAHGSVFSGVSLLPLYDPHKKLMREKGDVLDMQKVHNLGRLAIKIWDKPNSAFVRREVNFLQAAAGHPNISALQGVYCEAPRKKSPVIWLLVLEHCTGGDLFDMVRDTQMPQDKVMEVVFSLFSALAHLHALGIVHRDVKAENVVLQRQHAVLIDFGISAYVDDAEEMVKPVGSPGYAAPEVIATNPRRYNQSVDVFATGVLTYFMLYRTLPFWGESHEDMLNKTRACEVNYPSDDRNLSESFVDLTKRMLSKEPDSRPSALEGFQQLASIAPPELTSSKGAKAYRIALAGLVKLGHLDEPGDENFDEFSQSSPPPGERDVSAAPSTASNRSGFWDAVESASSTLRQASRSLRIPRVGPTISKVMRNIRVPTLRSRSSSTRVADGGNGHGDHDPDDLGHCLGAVDLDARDAEEGSLKQGAPESCGAASTTITKLGNEKSESFVYSDCRASSSKERPSASSSECRGAGTLISAGPDLVMLEECGDREVFGGLGDEFDIRSLDGKENLKSHDEVPAERNASPDREAEIIPRLMVVAAPPSSAPPMMPTPPAGVREAPVPKHRQRGLAIFRKLLSAAEE
ncbi:unnamed protein product [Effrenium voratum]|uniref:Protein kinase domain-containing protein n=1 Tax=Effrenium voratum TaxID=2562239 RepID=A0AA36I710_9DINO|nr:unnamed protein product [Effrenium voratum]